MTESVVHRVTQGGTMIRAGELVRPLGVPWRPLFVVGWFGLSAALLLLPVTIALLFMPHDWMIWLQVPARWEEGRLYDEAMPDYYFVFAPLAGWILALLVPLG